MKQKSIYISKWWRKNEINSFWRFSHDIHFRKDAKGLSLNINMTPFHVTLSLSSASPLYFLPTNIIKINSLIILSITLTCNSNNSGNDDGI
jgi:hypothetical protein